MWSAAEGAGGEWQTRLAESSNPLCAGCLTQNHYFCRARAVAVYDGAARDHVHELKYRARTELAPALARMMAEVAICDGMAAECDCVVPVPLHYEKAARRGFNQAELLARDVGSCWEFQWRLGGPSIARSGGEEAKRFWTRAIVVLTW